MTDIPPQSPILGNVTDFHETRQAFQQVQRVTLGLDGRLRAIEGPGGRGISIDAYNVTYSPNSGTLSNWLDGNSPENVGAALDQLADGDKLTIDWDPTTYVPATTPTEVNSVNHLTAHLYGVDQILGPLDALKPFFNGTFLESFDALVTSDGSTITMSLEQTGGGDLTMVFSDGHTILDTTPPATIALTAGTDTVPQTNYVYILQGDKILTQSTTGFPSPSVEHIKIGYFRPQSASLVNTGASGNNWLLANQNWNDHVQDPSGQGHMSDLSARVRREGAQWFSGCQGTATQDGTDLWVSIATGVVYQIHPQTFAALDSDTAGAGDMIVVINDPDAAHTLINSLNSITKLSDGTVIGNNKFIKSVLWAATNKTGEVSPMFLNLPSGQYNTAAAAARDVDGHANFTIPAAYNIESSVGFLVSAFVCKHTAAAMEIQSTEDLRGQNPNNVAGSGTGGGDVTAAAVLADNAVIRGDGGTKGVQTSGVLINDSNNVTGAATLDVSGNITVGGTVDGVDIGLDAITRNDTQTMTNKTITSPIIDGGIILVPEVDLIIDMADNASDRTLSLLNSEAGFVADMSIDGALSVSGDIAVDGTVDGVDISTITLGEYHVALAASTGGQDFDETGLV